MMSEVMCSIRRQEEGGDRQTDPGAWLRLGLGIAAILLFMFGLDPLLSKLKPVAELTAFVEARDIDAGAYWWSDSEEYAPSWLLCRDSLKYSGSNGQEDP